MRQPLRKCAVCGLGAEEECARCGRPLCKLDGHDEIHRCRVCEREYSRRLYSGRVIAIFALVAGVPIAAGLALLASGLIFDGLLLVGLGPVAAAAVRALVIGKRSSLRKEFLGERTGRLLEGHEAPK